MRCFRKRNAASAAMPAVGRMRKRLRMARRTSTSALPAEKKALPKASGRGAPAIDDDMADIEAILRKRGIT